MMTVVAIMAGLLPIMWGTGTGFVMVPVARRIGLEQRRSLVQITGRAGGTGAG